MNGFRDRAAAALRKAAAPTLEQIREDAVIEGLPSQVGRLLGYLAEHLFDPGLTVATWRRQAGIGDNAVSVDFKAWIGRAPSEYLVERRLETGARLLAATDIGEHRIAYLLGFTSYRTFRDRYKHWAGKDPSEGRDHLPPEVDIAKLRRALRGELSYEEGRRVVELLRRYYPEVEDDPEPRIGSSAPIERVVVDGADFERYQAEGLWQRIRTLPFEEQKRRVRAHLFRSTVFFDLVREKSREEGRQDRECGVRIGELALVSLEGHEEVFGERIHDLRALGWASLANARRLALDAEGAEADLERADEEWSIPRGEMDLAISAEIRLLKAGVHTSQCRFGKALELLGESIRLSQLTGELALQAQALIQRASVRGYMEEPRESIADLRSALRIDHGDQYLVFAAVSNLANMLARFDCAGAAAGLLESLKKLSANEKQPLARYQAQWLEGVIVHALGKNQEAETLFLGARSGFSLLGELPSLALVSLDLSIFYLEQNRRLQSSLFARQTVVILQPLKLGEKALAAVELLAKELEVDQITGMLLRKIRQRLIKDPLLEL